MGELSCRLTCAMRGARLGRPLCDHIQSAIQETLTTGITLYLAAGSLGYLPCFQQQYIMYLKIMLFCHSPANRSEDALCLRVRLQSARLNLGDDHQSFQTPQLKG